MPIFSRIELNKPMRILLSAWIREPWLAVRTAGASISRASSLVAGYQPKPSGCTPLLVLGFTSA